MTDRPILFSGPMVLAINEGRKTQTRRVVKPQPIIEADDRMHWNGIGWTTHHERLTQGTMLEACPYGQPGDRLWVRERQRVLGMAMAGNRPAYVRVQYEADGAISAILPYPDRLKGVPKVGKCLAYGGFRESSRILLEITDVRVERVQDISNADILAEGIQRLDTPQATDDPWDDFETYYAQAFRTLWDSINAARGYGWDANPWVWVVEFRRIAPASPAGEAV